MSTTMTSAALTTANEPTSTIPSFSSVLTNLAGFTPVLYRALEHAAHEMRSFFEPNEERPDAFLAPALVRYYAKKYLKRQGIDASEFEIEELANNGLSLIYAGYHLRILKSSNGQLPPPGDSERKQQFYSQQTAVFSVNSELVTTTLNLLVLWSFDPSFNVQELWLACPKAGGIGRASVEAYWSEKIPHPASNAQIRDESDTTMESEDLPITLNRDSVKKVMND